MSPFVTRYRWEVSLQGGVVRGQRTKNIFFLIKRLFAHEELAELVIIIDVILTLKLPPHPETFVSLTILDELELHYTPGIRLNLLF